MLFQKLLNVDKNNSALKYYHKSNKIMIPLMGPSILLNNDNYVKPVFDVANLINLGFHSYFSFSTIITDYHKKIPFINETLLRAFNLKSHSILILLFSYNLYNKYYRPEVYYFEYLRRRETLPYNHNK
tara:strand:+ start:9 stop:392 length:384 start_codon:yes stop_codon:yes gene_type:complete